MKPRWRQFWRSVVVGWALVAVLAITVALMRRLFATPYTGTDTASKVLVGGPALVGILATALVTLVGLLLK
jgi:hypothetical protein